LISGRLPATETQLMKFKQGDTVLLMGDVTHTDEVEGAPLRSASAD
jgi:hypothetical protein